MGNGSLRDGAGGEEQAMAKKLGLPEDATKKDIYKKMYENEEKKME